ncbi:NAD-dependent epimerase/dehydratase family protein [Brevibacillus fluminis]|uniref:NAD-dependent epimerase/dehydratase family protein n=1 Tax=Brevibacillus fluminis TaxID=511487 RepID=A0A3M8DCV9_9BACL|nr:NAD-dependent epimerase/dehydratase family protein [Brevibacillus fluminis]RNB85856.1 NAD-dependent epimerase/dehydratase family protein [Brevibacillus fluminis]
MEKILVLGGTRFFGKRLVHKLLESGADVTVATRGLTPDPFGQNVKRLVIDRDDARSLQAAAQTQDWDIVYDNICYSAQNALDANVAFDGRVGRYLLTSTLSVYDFGPKPLEEADFAPETYPIVPGTRADVTYQEGKRQAEAVFFQKASFPVAAVRFPIVLGEDDYTKRLHDQIERVSTGKLIGVPNPDALVSFILSDEAARFLSWLAKSDLTGPVNACSNGSITVGSLLHLIEEALGKRAVTATKTDAADHSPFGVPDSWHMSTAKAKQAGFTFNDLNDWLPQLVQKLSNN